MRSLSYGMTLLGGLVFFSLLPVCGHSEPASSVCPALPEQLSGNGVALYGAKAADTPGFVCAQVMNGLSEDLAIGGASLRLQKWTKEKWGHSGGFQDFLEPSPPGVMIGMALPLMMLPVGKHYTARLPRLGQPAPAGRYRVCFHSELVQPDGVQTTICSAEFTLP
jgi:hypothetical protein